MRYAWLCGSVRSYAGLAEVFGVAEASCGLWRASLVLLCGCVWDCAGICGLCGGLMSYACLAEVFGVAEASRGVPRSSPNDRGRPIDTDRGRRAVRPPSPVSATRPARRVPSSGRHAAPPPPPRVR